MTRLRSSIIHSCCQIMARAMTLAILVNGWRNTRSSKSMVLPAIRRRKGKSNAGTRRSRTASSWETASSRRDLEAQIAAFVEHYNHSPYHESLNHLTTAGVYFGRGYTILLERLRIKRDTIINTLFICNQRNVMQLTVFEVIKHTQKYFVCA